MEVDPVVVVVEVDSMGEGIFEEMAVGGTASEREG